MSPRHRMPRNLRVERKGPPLSPTCTYCGGRCEGGAPYAKLKNGRIVELFCSESCLKREIGYGDDVDQEVARQVRKECNWLHLRVCEVCKRKVQDLHRKMQE